VFWQATLTFEPVQATTRFVLFASIEQTMPDERTWININESKVNAKQHWRNSVCRKQKMPAQAKARDQAKASQAEEVLKRQGRSAQDVPLLRHKWDATLLRQPLAESQKLWQLEA